MEVKQCSMISYNCSNFNGEKHTFIKNLLTDCDFLLLQETWKYQDELLEIIDRELNVDNVLFNINGNIKGMACSPMNPDEQLVGRPYGGCAILYKDTINCNIEELKCESSRLMAILLSWDSFKILLINVYMPTDSGVLNNEYTEVLNEICNMCITTIHSIIFPS